MAKKWISVFGSSQTLPDNTLFKDAIQAGGLMAGKGLGIINGGYQGIMESSLSGGTGNGGDVLGVTCSLFRYATPNPYLTEEVKDQRSITDWRNLSKNRCIPDLFRVKGGRFAESFSGNGGRSKFNTPRPLIFWTEYWKPFIDQVTKILLVGDVRIAGGKLTPGGSLPIFYVENLRSLDEILDRHLMK